MRVISCVFYFRRVVAANSSPWMLLLPMWLQDIFGRPASLRKSSRDQITSHRDRHRSRPRNFERLETRHLLAAAPVTFSQAIFTPLNPISVSQTTGEKPESKLWENDGHWWSVMPDSSGTWIWRLDGTTWTHVLATDDAEQLSTPTCFRREMSPRFSVRWSEYRAGLGRVRGRWCGLVRVLVAAAQLDEHCTAEQCGNRHDCRRWQPAGCGSPPTPRPRLKFATATGTIRRSVRRSRSARAFPPTIFPILRVPDGSVGVLWSNQNAKRFYFRVHQPATILRPGPRAEIAAGQAALKSAPAWPTIICTWRSRRRHDLRRRENQLRHVGKTKTRIDRAPPQRRLGSDAVSVDTSGTRPMVMLDEVDRPAAGGVHHHRRRRRHCVPRNTRWITSVSPRKPR